MGFKSRRYARLCMSDAKDVKLRIAAMTTRHAPGRKGWECVWRLVLAGVACGWLVSCASPPAGPSGPAASVPRAEERSATPAPSPAPSVAKAPAAQRQAESADATAAGKERVAPTDAEREKLAALIRERVAARAKGGHPEDRKSTSEPPVVPGRVSRQLTAPPKPAGSAERATARDLGEVRPAPEKGVEAPPTPAASQPAGVTPQEPAASPTVTSQPAPDAAARGAESSGCKGPQPDAPVPPPPDQPQPKFVLKNPRCVREHVWAGQKAEFQFEIANEGEGPLQILLKRG
jgi:hypothetical protein